MLIVPQFLAWWIISTNETGTLKELFKGSALEKLTSSTHTHYYIHHCSTYWDFMSPQNLKYVAGQRVTNPCFICSVGTIQSSAEITEIIPILYTVRYWFRSQLASMHLRFSIHLCFFFFNQLHKGAEHFVSFHFLFVLLLLMRVFRISKDIYKQRIMEKNIQKQCLSFSSPATILIVWEIMD